MLWPSPSTFVAVVPGGKVWGRDAAVLTPGGELLVDLSMWVGLDPSNHPFFRRAELPSPMPLEEAVVLAAPRGDSYFHWMFDVLPRLEILRRAGRSGSSDASVILNQIRHRFQEDTIDRCGIPRDRVIETTDDTMIEAERLIVPSFPGNSGEIPGWVCDFLRDRFLEQTGATGSAPEQRLYITRGESPRRRVVNEQDVLRLLEDFGFRAVDPGQMSVAEQARLFADADVIVAPHGGALTNLVFCKSGTRILELFSPEYVNVCFWSVANLRKLDYHYLLATVGDEARVDGLRTPRPGTELHEPGAGSKGMVVDLSRLGEALRRLGLRQTERRSESSPRPALSS